MSYNLNKLAEFLMEKVGWNYYFFFFLNPCLDTDDLRTCEEANQNLGYVSTLVYAQESKSR